MTTIVANHECMASDSWATDSATRVQVQKFWRIRGWLIGGAGTYSNIIEVIAELRKHRKLSPKQVLAEYDLDSDEVDLLLLSPTRTLYLSEGATTPYPVTDGFAAIGSGAQGALVAMHMGCAPAAAVKLVKLVDPSTGGRIITRKL